MSVSILIVDDEPDIIDLFKRRFRQEIKNGDFEMHFAASGEDALHQLGSQSEPEIMLILSDINMPGMNGIELLQKTKELWPKLPVAMITAYGDDESQRKALAAGASEFLAKPIDFKELKIKIAEMLAAEGT